MEDSALKQDGENDYTLVEGHGGVWITVDNISVYIVRDRIDGVIVELFQRGNEMDDPIASTQANYP